MFQISTKNKPAPEIETRTELSNASCELVDDSGERTTIQFTRWDGRVDRTVFKSVEEAQAILDSMREKGLCGYDLAE